MQERDSQSQSQIHTYKKGDLVMAKITGYPWWPGTVTQIKNSDQLLYRVDFIADTTHAYLPLNKIISYTEGREQIRNMKKKCKLLHEALLVAEQRFQSKKNFNNVKENLLRDYTRQQSENKLIETEQQAKQLNICLKITLDKGQQITQVKPSYSQKKEKILQKQQLIKELLIKYNLLSIPSASYSKIQYHRSKLISKVKKIKNQSCELNLVIKKIYNLLKQKQIKKFIAKNMAISLGRQVFYQKKNKNEYLKNLFRWIRVLKLQQQHHENIMIQRYCEQWFEWQKNGNNKEKPSHMTNYQ